VRSKISMGASSGKLHRRSKRSNVLVLGLENSGKTSILNAVCEGTNSVLQLVPTKGMTRVPLSYNGFHVNALDVGGSKLDQQNWMKWYAMAHAVIYVIDSSDATKLEDNGTLIQSLLSAPDLFEKPFLVFANKQDIYTSASAAELSDGLNLHLTKGRPWRMLPCSSRTGEGIQMGFEWLVHAMGKLALLPEEVAALGNSEV